MNCIHQAAYTALMLQDPQQKCAAVHQLFQDWQLAHYHYANPQVAIMRIEKPGRPDQPVLVPPKDLAKRSLHTESGRVIFMHAIAHIEFNAINLALDAVYRFTKQPHKFYQDWLKVADDEARHFALLCDYLHDKACHYGDYSAHNGLWEMTVKTDHNILHRMALIPRVLEARGLDVSPSMIKTLSLSGDAAAADVLSLIYHDEITHVEIGSHWFNYHCERLGLKPEETFIEIVMQYMSGKVRGPFNEAARLIAGFKQDELNRLKALAS